MSLRSAFASTSRAIFSPSSSILLPCTCSFAISASRASPSTRRAFSQSTATKGPQIRKAARPVAIQQLRDDAIRLRQVKLVVPEEEGGGLGPIKNKEKLLKEIDRTKYWLLQVDEQELSSFEAAQMLGQTPRAGSPPIRVAICKLVDKKESFDRAKERSTLQKAKKKASHTEEKELQLTWGVSLNDLNHKLKKAQQTLTGKGGRVALVITAPKGSKLPAKQERDAFVDMLKKYLGYGEGQCKEWKPDEWRGAKTTAFLQGIKQESVAAAGDATGKQVEEVLEDEQK